MSKTSQRIRSYYEQGFNDAKSGYGYRWKKHPFIKHYDDGFREYFSNKIKRDGIIQKVINKFHR